MDTNVPEATVSIGAALDGCTELAVANVAGSNSLNTPGCDFACAAFLVLAARHHQALPAFSAVMLSFVVPLTIVTLPVPVLRTQRTGG